MTKQELIEMMGSEDKANWALERVLESIKPEFVLMVLKATADKAEKQYNDKVESGYYKEFSEFPEGFSLFSEPEDSPLSKQYDENRKREIEESGDKQFVNFTKNVYVHAMWHKPHVA